MCDPDIKSSLEKLEAGINLVIIPRLKSIDQHLEKLNGTVATHKDSIATLTTSQAVIDERCKLTSQAIRDTAKKTEDAQKEHAHEGIQGLIKKNATLYMFIMFLLAFIVDVVKEFISK